jgi:hypothetical protein
VTRRSKDYAQRQRPYAYWNPSVAASRISQFRKPLSPGRWMAMSKELEHHAPKREGAGHWCLRQHMIERKRRQGNRSNPRPSWISRDLIAPSSTTRVPSTWVPNSITVGTLGHRSHQSSRTLLRGNERMSPFLRFFDVLVERHFREAAWLHPLSAFY